MRNDHEILGRPTPATPAESLAHALDAAVSGDTLDNEALHHAVARYVASAKTHGIPPQEVIVALKEELRCRAMPRLSQDEYTALAEQVVRWGIDDFYGG